MKTDTLAARHIFTRTVTAQITQHQCTCTLAQFLSCVPKTGHYPRVIFHLAPHSTLNTSTNSLSPSSPVLLSSSSPKPYLLSTHQFIDFEDPRQDGTSTEFHSSTGYEPKKGSSSTGFWQNQTIDDQDDTEEIGVQPLSCSQSLTHSGYDTAESIATPPDSDLEDETTVYTGTRGK